MKRGDGPKLTAALLGLLAYGIGLGWTIGGTRCLTCGTPGTSAA